MDTYDMFFKKFNQGEKGMIQIYKGPGIFIKLLILEAWKTSWKQNLQRKKWEPKEVEMGKPLRWQFVILKLNEYEKEPKEQ